MMKERLLWLFDMLTGHFLLRGLPTNEELKLSYQMQDFWLHVAMVSTALAFVYTVGLIVVRG